MMAKGQLEHVNFTVSNPDETAAMLGRLFDWKVRWSGDSIHGGRTVHIGSDHEYIALYTSATRGNSAPESYFTLAGLNHVGIVVEDLEATEQKVKAEGLDTFNHADYDPGRRFYFRTEDNVEFEVICYL